MMNTPVDCPQCGQGRYEFMLQMLGALYIEVTALRIKSTQAQPTPTLVQETTPE